MADTDLVVIPKNRFRALLAKLETNQVELNEIRSSMGGLVSDASKNHNLHPGATRSIRRLKKMSQAKREEELYHFDAYRAYMGWDKSGDMFRQEDAEEAPIQTTPIPRPAKGRRKPRLVEVPAEAASA